MRRLKYNLPGVIITGLELKSIPGDETTTTCVIHFTQQGVKKSIEYVSLELDEDPSKDNQHIIRYLEDSVQCDAVMMRAIVALDDGHIPNFRRVAIPKCCNDETLVLCDSRAISDGDGGVTFGSQAKPIDIFQANATVIATNVIFGYGPAYISSGRGLYNREQREFEFKQRQEVQQQEVNPYRMFQNPVQQVVYKQEVPVPQEVLSQKLLYNVKEDTGIELTAQDNALLVQYIRKNMKISFSTFELTLAVAPEYTVKTLIEIYEGKHSDIYSEGNLLRAEELKKQLIDKRSLSR